MREQMLDEMDLERERGITIKANAVRLDYTADDGDIYELNLIDTPGHVDFTYEVSRSLEACEGALLLVDASQGVEAQTLANAYLAIEEGLEIIPVVNKIDLPAAEPDRVAAELAGVLGGSPDEVLRVSAKTGEGVAELLEAIVHRLPAPAGDPRAALKALVFDSHYDTYRGVVSYVRIMDGSLHEGDPVHFMITGVRASADEVGVRRPRPRTDRASRSRRGGLSHHRGQGDRPRSRWRHRDPDGQSGPGPAARLSGAKADGVLRALSHGGRRVRATPRGAGEAATQRFVARVSGGNQPGARVRLPVRVPRPAPYGDRPGTPRARVRPRPGRHGTIGGLPGESRPTAR